MEKTREKWGIPQRIRSIKKKKHFNKIKILELKNTIKSKNSVSGFNAILDTGNGYVNWKQVNRKYSN